MRYSILLCLALFAERSSASAKAASKVVPKNAAFTSAAASSNAAVTTTMPNPRGGGSKELSISLPVTVATGVLLAFNSGYINGCCLSGGIIPIKQAVAAVTGAYTVSAVGYSTGNYQVLKTQLTVIASYMGGSCIAGVLNPRPVTFRVQQSIGPTFLIGAALLYMSSNMAGKCKDCMAIFYMAAIANGIQNSVTSVHTGNLIRSAHYSGMTSDMGTFIGQILRGNNANLYRLKVCASLAAAFWSGGVVSFFATQRYASASLMFSAALYAVIGLGVLYLQL